MKKCLIILCLFIFAFAKAQTAKEFEVNFETASYHLSDSETAKINNYISMLPKETQSYSVTIIGHTDNVGNLEYNKILSDNRAKEISAYFLKKGFPEKNIKTLGKAYAQPIAANLTETGKAKNRRVTIFISHEIPKVNDLGGLKLEEDTFAINAQKQEVVNYKSGSKITIPADAFTDENGNVIKGKVDLTYVEYRNPVDFILGNIPMDYEKDHFNSAGMYKILAFKDGNPIFLRDGKTIDIDFPLESELPNLNFYNYDTISNKWTELSKLTDNVIEENEGEIFGSEADFSNNTKVEVSVGSKIIAFYTDYESKCATAKQTITDGIALASDNTSIFEKYTKEQQRIENELLASKQQRDSSQIKRQRFETIKIDRSIKQYKMRISRNKLKIDRIPKLIEKAKLSENAASTGINAYIEKQEKFKTQLLKTNGELAEAVKKLELSKITSTPQDTISRAWMNKYYAFWDKSKIFMTGTESQLSVTEWLNWFDIHKPEMLQRYKNFDINKYCAEENRKMKIRQQEMNTASQSAGAVVQSLKISKLGIYNCDQIARLENPVIVTAKYKTENGETLNPVFIYVIDSKINGILRYDGNYGYSPERFAYGSASKTTLLAFDGNGGSYILNASDFTKSLKGKSSAVLTMKKIENISSREALANLF
ncbi:OmpA family protein [Flavobacterium sp. 3HN19-14]|uniref:OmpA family protein n=1 Tax=Flavobacterium sp. 3HN19-14 TaxID=3448133 RepID=UPI003EDF4387